MRTQPTQRVPCVSSIGPATMRPYLKGKPSFRNSNGSSGALRTRCKKPDSIAKPPTLDVLCKENEPLVPAGGLTVESVSDGVQLEPITAEHHTKPRCKK